MYILGIGLSHCCGVCLIKDDEILFAQEEDRFSRRRRHKGWPEQSLAHVLEKYKLNETDIDLCVLSDIQSSERVTQRIRAKKTIVVHHHLAHVAGGWGLIPWKDFNAVSLDGGGDFGSWLSFGIVRDRKLLHWESNCGYSLGKDNVARKRLFYFDRPGMPFGTYWSMPAVINFGMLDKHAIGGYEGKLMGLAGYGKPEAFDCKKAGYDGDFSLKKKGDYYYLITHGHPKIGDKENCVTPDGKEIPLSEVRRLRKKEKVVVYEYDLKDPKSLDFAANFGALLQKKTNAIVSEFFEKNFSTDVPIVLSGGAFANVVVNGLLNQKYQTFVTPPMGDEGLALGAAAWGAYISGIKELRYPGLYLGYDAGKNTDVDIEKIGQLLADKKVVGLIDGRMEIGPRALGARTILSDAQDNNVNFTINERLERVEYMPFAPVILYEQAADVLMGWNKNHVSSEHMTLVYTVNPKWHERIKGVVHVDNTVRPQVIRREVQPLYYDILHAYYQKTGIPVLINTSFNVHGEPILRTVEEGIDALKKNRIDALVAGNKIHYQDKR